MAEKKGKYSEYARDQKGRFLPGFSNPGRPKGSLNRKILSARDVVAAKSGDIIKKALEQAQKGDPVLLKFFCDRIMGKGFDIGLYLKDECSKDQVKSLIDQINEPGVTPEDGAGLIKLIELKQVAEELSLLQEQVKKLQAKS